jgi:hypothetical protein
MALGLKCTVETSLEGLALRLCLVIAYGRWIHAFWPRAPAMDDISYAKFFIERRCGLEAYADGLDFFGTA